MKTGDKLVGNWLLLLCFMLFGMVAGGGHARTIGAGYILQVWRPVTGFIPPLNQADWQHLFALYQQTAQFHATHPAMTEQTFKSLFWPMFWDRVWGRVMALVFLIPLAIFRLKRRITTRLALWLIAIFAAGGAQAAFGWYMVRTGLEPGILTPPPAWLAPHFLSALLILAALLWTALTIKHPHPEPIAGQAHLKPWLNTSILLIFATAGFGALVAATNAVTVFNTFPLMGGHWIPQKILAQQPAWTNFLSNQATVQFTHRALASLTALTTLTTAFLGLRAPLPPAARDHFLLLAGLISLQYLLGMVTIILGSASLGFIHELNAVLLFATAIAARHSLRGATPSKLYSPHSIAAAE
jgi:cytochrome c oxidase assembly protein subunit 15